MNNVELHPIIFTGLIFACMIASVAYIDAITKYHNLQNEVVKRGYAEYLSINNNLELKWKTKTYEFRRKN